MSRRKIESQSISVNDEYRQSECVVASNAVPQQPSERKSVFERLGRLPITRTIDSRRGLTRSEYEETDLRIKVRQKRGENVSPTPLSTSISQPISQCVPSMSSAPQKPQSPRITALSSHSSHKSSTTTPKTEDNKDNKVKSLVMVKRSPSPATHPLLISFSSVKRSANSMQQQSGHKWDDDDDEELERKRLQLQRELQELETSSGNEEQHSAAKPDISAHLQPSVEDLRSRSSSTLSESGSYTSTIKSLTKTESSSCSNNDNNKTSKSATRRDNPKSVTSTDSRHHSVSSSVSRSVKYSDNSNGDQRKSVSTGVKLDRHGNVRISLDEQERQKRLRAERFSQKRSSPTVDLKRKNDQPSSSANFPRDHSYSPPAKRSTQEVVSNEKSNNSRHDNQTTSHKSRCSEDTKKDDYKLKSDSRTKHEVSYGSRNTERGDSLKSKLDVKSGVSGKDDRVSHLSVAANSDKKRDHSRDSRYSDRDNLSVTSSHDRKRGAYSREHSPAHSSHSKISRISRVSRASSVISDGSRRSKSDAVSNQVQERVIHSANTDSKSIEKAEMAPIIDEMSPISADSSIPDVCEIDMIFPSQESETTTTVGENEEKILVPRIGFDDTKNEDESDDNFSDWSEGEDELLLQTDGFETLDEAGNLSETTQEKDLYNDYKMNAINRRDSSRDVFSPQSKEADDALEAISDDELDAIIGESEPVDSALDSKNTSSRRQMLDALEIDWKSLIREPKTKPEFIPGSARKRFTPANVLMRSGFSQAFAGPLMTQKIIEFCQNELKEDFVPFRHPIAAVHALINERIRERRYLFQVDSTHSTALSGRKDLQIRKMLNKSGFKMFDNNNLTNNNNTSCSIDTINCNDSAIAPIIVP